ncbi:MAG TPA: lysylphosphatidylglycerol synthase transmembrane domain-containing protein [Thermoanaerobaculia bacterium]|nr:lysylphosphatidylglycerol synthase transmembrane domain-containing protein [Thermoanaerobaculia bacterium]
MKRILQIALIVALTVFFLWLFLKNANLREVGQILRQTDLRWIFVGFAVNFLALVLRTVRWQTLLDPDSPPPFYATFFANTVGYMLSNILPIRAADVARPVLLARRTSHRVSGALGTVLTERILDLTSILSLFVYFAFRRWNEFSHNRDIVAWLYIVRIGAIASVAILIALAVLIVGLSFFRPKIRRLHEWLGKLLPQRFRSSWMNFFDTFTETLEIAKHKAVFAKVVLCTMGVWACLTSQFWFATKSLDRPLPYDASFFVTGVTTVGVAIPTPGAIGGFHKACQLVLTRFYQFDVESSVAVAVLFHLIGTLPVLVLGLGLAAREGLRWKDVTRADSEG